MRIKGPPNAMFELVQIDAALCMVGDVSRVIASPSAEGRGNFTMFC